MTLDVIAICLVVIAPCQVFTLAWALWFSNKMKPVLNHFDHSGIPGLSIDELSMSAEDLAKAQANWNNQFKKLQKQLESVNRQLAEEQAKQNPDPIRLEALQEAAADFTEVTLTMELQGAPENQYAALPYLDDYNYGLPGPLRRRRRNRRMLGVTT